MLLSGGHKTHASTHRHTHVHTHTDTHIHTGAERGGDTSLDAAAEEARLRRGLGNRKVAQIRAGFCEHCFCLCYASLCKDHAARSWSGGKLLGEDKQEERRNYRKRGVCCSKRTKECIALVPKSTESYWLYPA